MSMKRFSEAMSEVDDKYYDEAVAYKRPKQQNSWMKWCAMAACVCLIAAVIPILNYFTEYQADDPNWSKNYFETSELSEIEAICGTDLLLDKIPLSNKYQEHYILEIGESGSFENPADWATLSATVNYGDSILDSNADSVFCLISFDGSAGDFNTELLNGAATVVINGYTVEQKEMSTEDSAAEGLVLGNKLDYHGWAKFTHNGYTYYVGTDSDSSDFFEQTLEQMLN